MQLFSKEQINGKRKDQTRELTLKNERLAGSLRKVLNLQKDIEFDADKAKKVADYQVWCEDLQKKMSKELANLTAYTKLVDDKKEEYYNLVARYDELEDKILDRKEELGRLDLQVNFKKELLKTHA
jgi:hypothetical protein